MCRSQSFCQQTQIDQQIESLVAVFLSVEKTQIVTQNILAVVSNVLSQIAACVNEINAKINATIILFRFARVEIFSILLQRQKANECDQKNRQRRDNGAACWRIGRI